MQRPAEESVSFINTCPFDCDLTSWTISDWGNRHNYTFPECRLSAGNTLTLYTRCKTGDESDDDSKQFWCYTPPHISAGQSGTTTETRST